MTGEIPWSSRSDSPSLSEFNLSISTPPSTYLPPHLQLLTPPCLYPPPSACPTAAGWRTWPCSSGMVGWGKQLKVNHYRDDQRSSTNRLTASRFRANRFSTTSAHALCFIRQKPYKHFMPSILHSPIPSHSEHCQRENSHEIERH